MKEEKITWQTNPDGVILEDLFFQLQSDSLKYNELVNWNPNEEPEIVPTTNDNTIKKLIVLMKNHLFLVVKVQ